MYIWWIYSYGSALCNKLFRQSTLLIVGPTVRWAIHEKLHVDTTEQYAGEETALPLCERATTERHFPDHLHSLLCH